jgi:hypothetical protein
VSQLRRLFLYKCAKYRGLLDVDRGATNESFLPYFIGDKTYVLISWIITLFKEEG